MCVRSGAVKAMRNSLSIVVACWFLCVVPNYSTCTTFLWDEGGVCFLSNSEAFGKLTTSLDVLLFCCSIQDLII